MDRPLDLPIFNSYTLNLPAWFATITKNYGNPKEPVWFALANPTTTARNISNRRHEHSIDIARKSITKPVLEKNEWDNTFEFKNHGVVVPKDFKKNMTLEHFSDLDQARIHKMEKHPNENFGNYPVLARGRPEALPKNVVYNRHHKNHSRLQEYGDNFLTKVAEVSVGRPIAHQNRGYRAGYGSEEDERSVLPSPVSSRTGSSRSGSKSRLSSLASSLRSSSRGGFEPENDSESDSDSGSDSESDEEEARKEAKRQADRNVFGRSPLGSVSGSSKSGSSRSSRSSKPSVSRGKPPLKRPEPKPKKIAGTTAPKPKSGPKPKSPKRVVAYHPPAFGDNRSETSEASEKPPTPVRRPVNIQEVMTVPDLSRTPTTPPKKTKGTTRWAKPSTAEKDEPLVQKARGRKPKYPTKELAYLAKLEQNKLGKQRKAEAKRKAKEEAGATTGTGLRKKRIHGVDYVLVIDESAPMEYGGKQPATHTMPDGTVMAGATHPKEETQEERRFKFEEEQRKKHVENLTAKTEKLREKEEKRLSKVSAKKEKPVKILTEKQIKDKLAREKAKARKEERFRVARAKYDEEHKAETDKYAMFYPLEEKARKEYDEKWKKPIALYEKVRRITDRPSGHWTDVGKEFRDVPLMEALMEVIPKWKPNKSDVENLRLSDGKGISQIKLWRATTKSGDSTYDIKKPLDYGENTFIGDFFLKWSKTVK